LSKVHEVTGAHDKRILGSGVSPDGCTVVTGAADESLKVGRSVVLSRTNSSLTGRLANDAVLEDLGGQGDSQAENDGEGWERCDQEQAQRQYVAMSLFAYGGAVWRYCNLVLWYYYRRSRLVQIQIWSSFRLIDEYL
jgi:hypothetical protein